MAQVPLSRGGAAFVDDADLELVSAFSWFTHTSGRNCYAIGHHCGKNFRMHNLLMHPPAHLTVDHIDGDGLNNRRSNLRICTHAENMRNMRSIKPRGGLVQSKGVRQSSASRFYAVIMVGGKTHRTGPYGTEYEAACAYDRAAERLHGEFARLNFDDPAGITGAQRRTLASQVGA